MNKGNRHGLSLLICGAIVVFCILGLIVPNGSSASLYFEAIVGILAFIQMTFDIIDHNTIYAILFGFVSAANIILVLSSFLVK